MCWTSHLLCYHLYRVYIVFGEKHKMSAKRKSYTLNFKISVWDYLITNNDDISDTARNFGISRKCVQTWKRDAKKIRLGVKSRSRLGRVSRKVRTAISLYPELDKQVLDLVKKRRAEKKSVTSKMICTYAKTLYPTLYPNS